MSGIVEIRHPVIVRHVPARARRVRRSIVAVTTPVRLIELNRAEMVDAGSLDGLMTHAHAGSLWAKSSAMPTVLALTSLLKNLSWVDASVVETSRENGAFHLLARSPLLACIPKSMEHVPMRDHRPERVVSDGTDRARADLADYLDGNVRVVGGAPYVRIRGPLLSYDLDGTDHRREGAASRRAWACGSTGNVASYARLRLIDAVWGEGEAERILRKNRLRVCSCAGIDGLEDGKDDILHFLGTIGESTRRQCGNLLLDPAAKARAPDAFAEVAALMVPWAELGVTGAVRLDEAPAVLDAFERSRAVLHDLFSPSWLGYPAGLRALVRFVRGYVEPALDSAMAPEDEAAFEGLGTGP